MKISFTNFKWFFLFGFLCAIENSFAQSVNFEWYNTIFNSDGPKDQKINDIAVSKIDSSVYIVGSCEGTNTAALGSAFSINLGISGFLAKYNKNGVRQWSFKVGGLGAEEISSVALNSAGEVIIGGYFEQTVYFQKNDASFVIGSSSPDITGNKNAFVLKVKADGSDLVAFAPDKQLFICANNTLSSGVSDIVVDSTDNVFASINFEQFIQNNGAPIVQHTGTGAEAVIIKYAAQSGVFTLANQFRVIQGSGNESITGLTTDNNKLYLVGNTTSLTIKTKQSLLPTIDSIYTAAGSGKNIFMAKCNNSNLNAATIQTSHNDEEQFVNDIQYHGGNLFITGSANIGNSFKTFLGPTTGLNSLAIKTPDSNEKVFLAKYSTIFIPVWVRILETGESDNDKGSQLDVDASGNIFITGHIKSDFIYKSNDNNYFFTNQLIATPFFETSDTISTSNQDAFVAKFNNNGQYQWIRLIGSASGNEDDGIALKTGGNSVFWGGHFKTNFNTLLNGVSSPVTGNSGKQNIIFGRILSCLNQRGSIVSNPSVVCAGEPFQLMANDYFGIITAWGRRDSNSMTPYNISISNDTLNNITVTGTTYFRFVAVEGTGCNSTSSDSIKIVPLPAPQSFTLSSYYPNNATDSIPIDHTDTFDPTMEYTWETSPDDTNWIFSSNSFDYAYPQLPDSFVYIRRSAKNPNCDSTYSDVTKIVRRLQGDIALNNKPCALVGDSVVVNLSLFGYDTVYLQVKKWESSTDMINFTEVGNYPYIDNIVDTISQTTYYKAELSKAFGVGSFYSDTIKVTIIPVPENIIIPDSTEEICKGSIVTFRSFNPIDNSAGLYSFEWTIKSLPTLVTILADTTAGDSLSYNFSYDSLLIRRRILIATCTNYTSVAPYFLYSAIESKGGALLDNNGDSEKLICKGEDIDLGLIGFKGDSIKWGYSFDGMNSSFVTSFSGNSNSVKFKYNSNDSYALIDGVIDILDLSMASNETVYLFAVVYNAGCEPDTSSYYKIRIAKAPASFGLGPDTLICSDSILLTTYNAFDITGISWLVDSLYGHFDLPNGITNTLYADTINTPIQVITKIDNGCVFYDTLYVTYSHAPELLPIPPQTICSDNASIAVLNLPSNFVSTFSDGVSFLPNSDSTIYNLEGFDFGENLLAYSVTNNNCLTSNVPVIDFVITRPFVAQAGPDIIRCASDTVTISSPNTQLGYWTSLDNSLTLEYPEGDSAHALVSDLAAGTNYNFVWTLNEGGCPHSSDTLMVNNGIESTVGNILSNNLNNYGFCSENNNVVLWSNVSNQATINWQRKVGSGGVFTDMTSETNDTLSLNNFADSTYIRLVANSNYCGFAYSDIILLRVQNPVIGTISGELSYCSNSGVPVQLILSNNSLGEINWTQSSDNFNFSEIEDQNGNILNINISDTTYFKAFTYLNGCFSEYIPFTINYLEAATGEIALDDTICYGTSPIDLLDFLTLDPPSAAGTWNISNGILNPSEFAGASVTVSFTTAQCPVTISDVVYISPVPNTDTIFMTECSQEIAISQPVVQNGVWNVPNGITYSETVATNEVIFTSGANGNNTALISYETSLAFCPNNYCYQFTFNPIDSVAYAGEDLVLNNTNSTELSATPPVFGMGHWEIVSGTGDFENVELSNTIINNLNEGTNILQWIVSNENCTEVIDELEITVNGLLIPTAFSPDGDGVNDKFAIRGLNFFKKVNLMVFNTMGQQVFTDDNYQSNWTGTDYKGNILPNDTYYIIMKFDNTNEYKGYVVIKK